MQLSIDWQTIRQISRTKNLVNHSFFLWRATYWQIESFIQRDNRLAAIATSYFNSSISRDFLFFCFCFNWLKNKKIAHGQFPSQCFYFVEAGQRPINSESESDVDHLTWLWQRTRNSFVWQMDGQSSGTSSPPPNPSRPIILLTLSLPCHGWKWRRLKKG